MADEVADDAPYHAHIYYSADERPVAVALRDSLRSADAAAAAQASMLADIRKKGIYAWAQEEKLKALKDKIRQQILSERKLDENQLKAMNPEDRASAESSIQEEITRRIKEAMKQSFEGQAKQAAADGKPPKPMIIDISV